MTRQYFPPDVSLRIDNDDVEGSQKLFPSAANLLYKALQLKALGNRSVVRLFRSDPKDGSLVSVFLTGDLKHVYVQPGPPPPVPQPETPPPFKPAPVKEYINDMWSGVAKGDAIDGVPTVIAIENPDAIDPPTIPALNHFHPDHVTADAYQLDFAWQEPNRLGVSRTGTDSGNATSSYPKPCMYSGAMKRLVSCVLGLGRTLTETAEYISGELPASYPDLVVFNQYDFRWLRTHGLYKGTDGSVWLIEISKDNGVLAMPLPTFDGTDEPEYLDWLAAVGDTDTMSIVLEFGALPTGEPFPTGTDLAFAISAGKIMTLTTAEELTANFYHDDAADEDKFPYFTDCGWAFSESGTRAHNTCRWYSRRDIVGPPPVPLGYPFVQWATNGTYAYDTLVRDVDGYRFADPRDRFMRAEHWGITINLLRNPLFGEEGEPIGVGNANLALVEEGYLFHDRNHQLFGLDTGGGSLNEDGFAYTWHVPPMWFPFNESEELRHPAPSTDGFGRITRDFPTDETDRANSTPPVYVFFVGEVLEIVRYCGVTQQPFKASALFRGTTIDFGFSDVDPYTSGGFDVGLLVPAYTREAYALMRFENPSLIGEGEVQVRLFGVGIGTVDLTNFPVPPGPIIAYATTGWLTGFGCNSTGYEITVNVAATVNTGPMKAYVVTDGINSDAALTYVQSPRMAQFGIPANYRVQNITFVGSCSDG